MMIRLLHLLGALAVAATGGVLVLCWIEWTRPDDGAIPLARRGESTRPEGTMETGLQERASPLMAAAQGFALYQNPPPPPVQEKSIIQEAPQPVAPVARPPAALPKFKVRGTICAGRPERSIALIWEPGSNDTGRWVKEGTQVGHFVIQEIRAGSVVYLDGEKLCEMEIERAPAPATVVASDGQPATSGAQTAVGDARPAQTTGRPKRPAGGGRFSVGSARTSAVD